jgi:hypothetical protein
MHPLSTVALVLALGSAGALAQDTPLQTPKNAPKGARVFIVSPQDGAETGTEVPVVFGAENVTVAPTSSGAPDSGHHHLLIDVTELPPAGMPIPNDERHRHYGQGQTQDTIHLEPGTHTLQLDFADSRHVQFDPPVVSQKITIEVK